MAGLPTTPNYARPPAGRRLSFWMMLGGWALVVGVVTTLVLVPLAFRLAYGQWFYATGGAGVLLILAAPFVGMIEPRD